jgi:hypothetical protein
MSAHTQTRRSSRSTLFYCMIRTSPHTYTHTRAPRAFLQTRSHINLPSHSNTHAPTPPSLRLLVCSTHTNTSFASCYNNNTNTHARPTATNQQQRVLSATSERVKCVDVHPNEPWILSALYRYVQHATLTLFCVHVLISCDAISRAVDRQRVCV